MNVYLAGKITKNGWRDTILNYRTGAHPERDDFDTWPVVAGAVLGHDYTGPFFISCDHGCAHGDGTHGAGAGQFYDGPHTADLANCLDEACPPRATVARLCLDAIRRSDLVFAWMPLADAHGTLFELGYALALGKSVIIGVTTDPPRDAWFACHAVHMTIGAESPRAALTTALVFAERWQTFPRERPTGRVVRTVP